MHIMQQKKEAINIKTSVRFRYLLNFFSLFQALKEPTVYFAGMKEGTL